MVKKQIRREKTTPGQDAWHTLRIGVPVAVLLLILLPLLI